ncbi:MAG: TonB-dependent receptor [Alphaproteobacteria bacterium]
MNHAALIIPMRPLFVRHVLMAGTALWLTALPVAEALAQEAEAAPLTTPEDDDLVMERMTITAQKREENIQDVPISVTAISGDLLQQRQVFDFSQLQFLIPGINFNAGVNSRQSASTIRGIGTGLFNLGIEGSVATVIDGVVIGREGAGISDFSDVERVEVLRGPQGTLFGKNASAGVISIVTKAPTNEMTYDFGASYGSFDTINLNGAVSGPIIEDVLLFRFSGYYNNRDGFLENVFVDGPQDDLNDRNEYGFRGKLEYRPTEDVTFVLNADYSRREADTGAFTLRSASMGGAAPNGTLTGLLNSGVPVIGPQSLANGVTPSPTNTDLAPEQSFFIDQEIYGVSGELTWDLGAFSLVSLTAYRRWDAFDNNDADLIPLPFLTINSGDSVQTQVSQEIRLQSPLGRRLEYVLGAFYFYQDIDAVTIQGGTAGLDLLGVIPPDVFLITNSDVTFEETNAAVFGQATYEILPDLRLIGGVRLLYSEIEGTNRRTVGAGGIGPFAGQNLTLDPETGEIVPFEADFDDVAVVWRAGLQYDVTEDANVFATVTRGYKSAGIVSGLTINALPGTTILPVVQPEIPFQIEAGARTSWFDGRLFANVTGFFTQIEDFQSQALIPTEGGTVNFEVVNVGEAETYGFEADLTAFPTDGLSLNVGLAYTNATFSDFPNAPCFFDQPVGPGLPAVDLDGNGSCDFQDLTGADLPNSPDWIVNAAARYDHTAVWRDVVPFLQLGVQYRTETVTAQDNDPNTIQDGYALVDFQAGVTALDGRISLFAFGRNITDADFVESIFDQPFDSGGYGQFVTFASERVFGVSLQVRY